MKKERLAHHLNSIKLCQSDLAIERCIERIFEEGNRNGWDESSRCPKCNREYSDIEPICEYCYSESEEEKE